MAYTRRDLTGRLHVGLPPTEAHRLFTPRGEQDYLAGWRPQFPALSGDDTALGTVFETDAHGHTATWVVTDNAPGRRICYARIIPHTEAGTVVVTLDPVGDETAATVTYQLTPLSRAGEKRLGEFAARYPNFLQSWQHAIATWLAQGAPRIGPESR